MKRERKVHRAEFKRWKSSRGLKTVSEIAAENSVHPVQVTQWKREMQEGAAQLFERNNKVKPQE